MIFVSIDDMRSNLDQLIRRVKEGGVEVVITDQNEPVAEMRPVQNSKAERVFGALQGQFSIGPEFFDALPADELAAWED